MGFNDDAILYKTSTASPLRQAAIVMFTALFLCMASLSLSVNLLTEGIEKETPFVIHMTTPHVASAPVMASVEVRYDVARVIGGLCIVVDGDEYHTSCWEADGAGPKLRVVRVLLEHSGEYVVQLLQVSGNGKRQSNLEQLLLQ